MIKALPDKSITREVIVDRTIEAINFRAKELVALHELADYDHRSILIDGLDRLENIHLRKIKPKEILGHLERLAKDLSESVGYYQKRLTREQAERYAKLKPEATRDPRVYNKRDPPP